MMNVDLGDDLKVAILRLLLWLAALHGTPTYLLIKISIKVKPCFKGVYPSKGTS